MRFVFIFEKMRFKDVIGQDEIKSRQIMSSLFEQSLLLLADMTAMLIADRKNITDLHSLWRKHANIE